MTAHFIILSYVVVTALYIWVALHTSIKTHWKIALGLLLPVLYISHYHGLKSMGGYPSNTHPPEKFQLISAITQQPKPKKNKKGRIFIWILTPNGEPRSYELPWSDRLHQQLTTSQKQIKQGKRVTGFRRQQQAAKQSTSNKGQTDQYRFSDSVEYRLPSKNNRPQ